MTTLSKAKFCELGFIKFVNIDKLLRFTERFLVGVAIIKCEYSLLMLKNSFKGALGMSFIEVLSCFIIKLSICYL